ncbi:MAG TPA: rod shape-determining protein MreC [Candidatus Paceibacterota bacterium]
MSHDLWHLASEKRKRTQQNARLLWSIIFFFALASVLVPLRRPLVGALWRVFPSLDRVGGALAHAGSYVTAPWVNGEALRAQNAELLSQLADAQMRAADRDTLAAENMELKILLGRPRFGSDIVRAGVIARPPQLPYDTLMIDAGEEDAVNTGDVVWSGDGSIVIGTVSDVYATSARVVLFSSAGVTHEGFLRGSVPVTVVGMGGGSLSVRIPGGVDVSVGDQIEFPGIEGGISETVASIDTQEGSAFKTLYLHLPINIFYVHSVDIQKNS